MARLKKAEKLKLFAGYLSTLWREPAGPRFGENPIGKPSGKFNVSGFEDDHMSIFRIVVRKSDIDNPESNVWDHVFINDEWCGNRCGGAQRLAELFAKYFD